MSSEIYSSTLFVLVIAVSGMAASLSPMEAESSIELHDQVQLLPLAAQFLQQQARLSTTSEVLTLNMTNLLILLAIKAVVFLFGFVGTGAGRSSTIDPIGFDQSDLLIFLSYAIAKTSDDYDCLNRVACERPEKLQEYLTASKMMMKVSKLLSKK